LQNGRVPCPCAVAHADRAAGRRSLTVHTVPELDERRTITALSDYVVAVIGAGAAEIGHLPQGILSISIPIPSSARARRPANQPSRALPRYASFARRSA